MKKYLIIILSILLVFSFVSCKQEPKEPKSFVHEYQKVSFADVNNPAGTSEVAIKEDEKLGFSIDAIMNSVAKISDDCVAIIDEYVNPPEPKAASVGATIKISDEEFKVSDDKLVKIDYFDAKAGLDLSSLVNGIKAIATEDVDSFLNLFTADVELSAKTTYKNGEEEGAFSVYFGIEYSQQKDGFVASASLKASVVLTANTWGEEKYPLLVDISISIDDIDAEKLETIPDDASVIQVAAAFGINGDDPLATVTWRDKTGDHSYTITLNKLFPNPQ